MCFIISNAKCSKFKGNSVEREEVQIYLNPDWLFCFSDEEGSKLGVRAGIRRSSHGVGGIGPLAPLTMSLSVPTPSGGSHGEKVSPGRRRPSYVPSTLAASTTIEHQEPSGKRQYPPLRIT